MAEERMVSVERALQIMAGHEIPLETIEVTLQKAIGSVLSQDMICPLDQPPFRQAAMDGYAVHENGESEFRVIGEVIAGEVSPLEPRPGEAVRIYTGARVPATANRIIVQENIQPGNGTVGMVGPTDTKTHIKSQGEQVKKGSLALPKGALLTPAAIGFLAGMGLHTISVHRKPKVGIVTTGNELVTAGKKLGPAQIYEGNSQMLRAALVEMGITEILNYHATDNLSATCTILSQALQANDVLLINGGISVGQYDHVYTALKELQVEGLFHKVRQKPGKPLFFGARERKSVLALPGNPTAALSCFYIYALPLLQKYMGLAGNGLRHLKANCSAAIENTVGRAQFLTGIYGEDGSVAPLYEQGLFGFQAFGRANALIFVPETVAKVEKGDLVHIFLLTK
tara:strand:+ start:23200 stop:24393 length:1194 start_codon:yes stop_codon:yes gene_type:complete